MAELNDTANIFDHISISKFMNCMQVTQRIIQSIDIRTLSFHNIIIHNVFFSVANPVNVLCATEKTSQSAITAASRPDVMTTAGTTKMGASSDGVQIRTGEVNDNIPLNEQSDDDSPFNTGGFKSRS